MSTSLSMTILSNPNQSVILLEESSFLPFFYLLSILYVSYILPFIMFILHSVDFQTFSETLQWLLIVLIEPGQKTLICGLLWFGFVFSKR